MVLLSLRAEVHPLDIFLMVFTFIYISNKCNNFFTFTILFMMSLFDYLFIFIFLGKVCVTALKYVLNSVTLAVGFNFGGIQLWGLQDLCLLYVKYEIFKFPFD